MAEATRPGQGSNNFIETSHIDILLLIRDKIADALNNGTKCSSSRMIPLSDTDACNVLDCPFGNVTERFRRIFFEKFRLNVNPHHDQLINILYLL